MLDEPNVNDLSLSELVKRFLLILDAVETSDSDHTFRPTQISSCRVLACRDMELILSKLRELVGLPVPQDVSLFSWPDYEQNSMARFQASFQEFARKMAQECVDKLSHQGQQFMQQVLCDHQYEAVDTPNQLSQGKCTKCGNPPV